MNIREDLEVPVSSIVGGSVENGEAHMPLTIRWVLGGGVVRTERLDEVMRLKK